MERAFNISIITAVIIMAGLFSCVRPFDIDDQFDDRQLIIDGYITDDPDDHEIQISFSAPFNSPVIEYVSDAEVTVLVNGLETIPFTYTEQGKYRIPNNDFVTDEGDFYQLIVKLDGQEYVSKEVTLAASPVIDRIDFELKKIRGALNQSEELGFAIKLTNVKEDGLSGFYRFNSEETWFYEARSATGIIVELTLERDEFGVPFRIASADTMTNGPTSNCWFSEMDNTLAIASAQETISSALAGTTIREVPLSIKFLYEYSILINQYGLSDDAYAFYELVDALSQGEGLLYNQQPGTITGNIQPSNTENDQKVIGMFQASGKKSHRAFITFNELPQAAKVIVVGLAVDCEDKNILFTPLDSCEEAFINIPDSKLTPQELVLKDSLKYLNVEQFAFLDSMIVDRKHWITRYEVEETECDSSIAEGQIRTAIRRCADCGALGGTKQKPEWWPN